MPLDKTASPSPDKMDSSSPDKTASPSPDKKTPLPFDLEQDDDTDNKWAWSDADKKEWNLVTNHYWKFCEYWYNRPGSDFLSKFPYELSFGNKDGKYFLSPDPSASVNKILVTASYNDAFHRLLRLRRDDDVGDTRGVVLTGQPGVGKTKFLSFLLAQLLSVRQVILLYNTTETYLFYRGQAYSRPTGLGLKYFPTRAIKRYYCPIWALIDMDCTGRGPPINKGLNIWPIQASSPNPARWKLWKKQYNATLFGMPLWTMEELIAGLPLRPEYPGFRKRLGKSLKLLNETTLQRTGDHEIDAALQVLQKERVRVKVMKEKLEVGEVQEDNCDEMCDGIGPSVTDQGELIVDDSDKPGNLVDNALKILLRNATEEFGFAPRSVYDGIFYLPNTGNDHAVAVENLKYYDLIDLVRRFSKEGELDEASHHVVAVHPRPPTDSDQYDRWEVKFKSTRIAREVAVLMRLEEDQHLRETYNLLYTTPCDSTLAGCVFEAIAHRRLPRCLSYKAMPQPTLMVSNKENPPLFSMHSPSTRHASLSSLASPHAQTMVVTRVDFARGLSNVTLDDDRYYIPTASNNPLFDSFTIHREQDKKTVISIFQITISPKHGGSAEGYLMVRKIIAHVRELLEVRNVRNVLVEIEYILVCPEDGSQHEWQMPIGWNRGTRIDDHRGKAYYLRVPV